MVHEMLDIATFEGEERLFNILPLCVLFRIGVGRKLVDSREVRNLPMVLLCLCYLLEDISS